MTELMQEIQALRRDVQILTQLVMKDKVDTTWIDEEDAAKSLGLCTRWLRFKVKGRGEVKPKYPFTLIRFRSTNGRSFQYSRKSIQEFKKVTEELS